MESESFEFACLISVWFVDEISYLKSNARDLTFFFCRNESIVYIWSGGRLRDRKVGLLRPCGISGCW